MLAQALEESGGPMSADERAWADEALGVRKRRAGQRVVTSDATTLPGSIRRSNSS